MRWWLLLVALGGCDAVFVLSGTDLPECKLGSFRAATPAPLADAVDLFSFDRVQDRGVIFSDGQPFEVDFDGPATRTPIALDPAYPMSSIALWPEGDRFFYTPSIEPPRIIAVRRIGEHAWRADETAPTGTFAGTPTLGLLGPRRVLVRLGLIESIFQEYEEQADETWAPVGGRREVPAVTGVNLSSDGLTMVYEAIEGADRRSVYAAQRSSVAGWFGDALEIMPGEHHTPQLDDSCRSLYTVGGDANNPRQIARYQR